MNVSFQKCNPRTTLFSRSLVYIDLELLIQSPDLSVHPLRDDVRG